MKIQIPVIALNLILAAALHAEVKDAPMKFDPKKDLISLHYDHAPDKDDGHSAAADRTLLETMFGKDWLARHVIAVSGTYSGEQGKKWFQAGSNAVMDAVWNERGGWIATDKNREAAVEAVLKRWVATLNAGGDVYVKEGGTADFTATVVKRLRGEYTDIDPLKRVHVVQHSNWNEKQSTPECLEYSRKNTRYTRISDANKYLNIKGGDAVFEKAARSHPVFGASWNAAFGYYQPSERIDFSDTGELMHILGLGEIGIDGFRKRFLEAKD
jgi:hypothetical protein